MLPHKLEEMSGAALGTMLVEYWEDLYLAGASAGEAEKSLAAVELLVP